MNKKTLSLGIIFLFCLFAFSFPTKNASAAKTKSPTPFITEIVGIYTPNIRVHFKINPVTAGQIIKVNYQLKPERLSGVKYNPPKNARRSGTVNAAASSTGSAIDLYGLPKNLDKYTEKVKVRIMVPGKSWSAWSNAYSM